jgi:hypothetical protein
MSQDLRPVNNGIVPEIQTTTTTQRLNVLSEQYVDTYKLRSRPTEWSLGGRPIYRRLPATSERYQVNFYNFAAESNILSSNQTLEGIEKVGYVYTPYGESINGPTSAEVIAADTNKVVLVKAGTILWEYGKTEVLPTLIDLEVLEVLSGKYTLAYQLVYDDAPRPLLYEVTDFSLSGVPMNLQSSTDSIVGWRYSPINAFTDSASSFWSNEDTYFPSYAQPTQAYLQWKVDYGQAYSKVLLRCPTGTAYSGTATLSYVNGSTTQSVSTVSVSRDSSGQYFEFLIESPESQTEWNVTFSSTTVSIQTVLVSGNLTLLEAQSAPSPRSALVMYPSNSLPKFVENTQGERVPAVYCVLAEVDVNSAFEVVNVEDLRTIIHRDYVPVADWVTKPFDTDLINLYEQVSEYPTLWMSPPRCMEQEYAGLTRYKIQVEA